MGQVDDDHGPHDIEVVCWFTGHVQGVGFRWRTERLLRSHAMSGYVRNLPDGRVELCLQGARERIHAAIEVVEVNLANHIDSVERVERVIDVPLGAFRIMR